MDQVFNKYPFDEQTVNKIQKILNDNENAQRIVFQFPKQYLNQSFELTNYFQNKFPSKQNHKKQFYTLFDSMKKQCCTDIIGAQHVSYEILIHFGQACFSQNIKKNHYYLFPTISKDLQNHIQKQFNSQKFIETLQKNQIKYVLTQQNLYEYFKTLVQKSLQQNQTQLLKLPYDVIENGQYQYLIFGYYGRKMKTLQENKQTKKQNKTQKNNILVILTEHPEQDNKLLSNIHLTLGSFSKNKSLFTSTPQVFVSSLQIPQISKSTVNYSKPLMIRMNQISQIQKYDTFGLLVSNAATNFSKTMITKCQQLLKTHNKKYFVFMMNNLNQVKLGNFPQIEVYVVISCYNNSCFSMKDFCRLVVTPMDLEVAFDGVSIGEYNFDLSHPENRLKHKVEDQQQTQGQQKQSIQKFKQSQNNLALSVQQKQQLILAQTLQTLDYYRKKQWKGLDFSQKKAVEHIKKGKIGLAQQYQPLQK